MRYLNKLIWSALIATSTALPALAQAPGGGAAGGGLSGGGAAGGAGLGGSAGAGGSMGGSLGGSSSNSGASLTSLSQTPQITAPTASGGNTGNSVSTSNFFAPYYANPYYQGILSNSTSNNNSPGGFGTPLFNSSGSTGGGNIGYAGSGGTTGSTGVRGTTGGKGTTSTNTTGIIIPLPVQISYGAVADFPVAHATPTQLQAEIVGMLRRSKELSTYSSIQISTEGSTVTLKGAARDRREARLIESMVRMTPGVRNVKNELTFPPE